MIMTTSENFRMTHHYLIFQWVSEWAYKVMMEMTLQAADCTGTNLQHKNLNASLNLNQETIVHLYQLLIWERM